MLFTRRWIGWILLLMWLGSASAAETGGRVALVIGNGGYTALKSLPNPKKDAAAVARALKGLGYRLVDRDGKPTDKAELDLDQKGLFRAVNALAQAAQGQEIAFLYYAGHGFQDGANSYLVPVDAPKPERADDLDILKSRSIALDRVLGKVDGKAQLMVAVFDACREIPELNTAVRASGLSGDNNPYQGLLPVYRGGIREPAGQATRTSRLIAYAGAAGQLVKDGAGEHSPYTELLLDQLTAATQKNKNIELTEFFQGVAWQFKSDPGGRQQPLLEVAAQPDTFYLLPGRPASVPEPPSATTGTLVIRSSQPPGVVIYVNGGRLGSAPQSLNLPAGQQATVTAKQAGYEEYQEKVWIQAGQRMDLNVTLKPLASPPVVNPTPPPPPVVTPSPVVGREPLSVFRDSLADGSEGPAMVVIPAETFQMGSPPGEPERLKSERQHEVFVAGFAMGQHEVTFAEYDRFCAATKRKKSSDEGWGRGQRPVINVDWHDAVAYAQWLSQQTGKEYHLPTEAEWEYACQGEKAGLIYCGGNDVDQVAWYNSNSGGKTHLVGQKAANGYGLYDLSGNVWEWTCSVYRDYGGAEKECAKKDTSDPLAVRGGSWVNDPGGVRSADRDGGDPTDRSGNLGFRLARYL